MAVVPSSGCIICVRLQCAHDVPFKAAWLAHVADVIPPRVFD